MDSCRSASYIAWINMEKRGKPCICDFSPRWAVWSPSCTRLQNMASSSSPSVMAVKVRASDDRSETGRCRDKRQEKTGRPSEYWRQYSFCCRLSESTESKKDEAEQAGNFSADDNLMGLNSSEPPYWFFHQFYNCPVHLRWHTITESSKRWLDWWSVRFRDILSPFWPTLTCVRLWNVLYICFSS